MFSRCLSGLLLCTCAAFSADRTVLRVCADPENLPFSNKTQDGFENRIAALVAKDLHAELNYTWWPQRGAYLENSLEAGECDAVMGVPSSTNSVLPTRPYYRSTYVLVTRKDRDLQISSLLDPRLETLRIGIHVVGNDYAPPAYLLAQRGLTKNLAGYSLYGGSDERDPQARLIEAVASGAVDVAVAWGPFAGYFAPKQSAALMIAPVSPPMFQSIPFAYDISAAVRKDDRMLQSRLQDALARQCAGIAAILAEYSIPLTQEGQPRCDSSQPAAYSSR
jgi:quinoprotein dehydrogenase-associated probable ABC transporter substrate-binding protein